MKGHGGRVKDGADVVQGALRRGEHAESEAFAARARTCWEMATVAPGGCPTRCAVGRSTPEGRLSVSTRSRRVKGHRCTAVLRAGPGGLRP
jgi:hypothetical protein